MIYTVTFNPSLDYVIQVDDLTLGESQQNNQRGDISWRKRCECVGYSLKSGN